MGVKDLQRLKDIFDPQAIAEGRYEDPPVNFAAAWLRSLEIVDAEQTGPKSSRIVYRFRVLREYLNPTGGLHGGATAMIFDVATTWLLSFIMKPGFWSPTLGTTRALNCTYFRPAMEGEVILLECEIMNAGRRLASLQGVMKREKDGAVIASCSHDKYNVDADTRM